MGYTSWECKECGRSLLCKEACGPAEGESDYQYDNTWMAEVVVIMENGSTVMGEYDGYGSVEGFDIFEGQPSCYHRACWELAGKPSEWNGESNHAQDQGWFGVTAERYDMEDPRRQGRGISAKPPEMNYYIILHHHRHGVSPYLVRHDSEPTQDDVIKMINKVEEFEPDREEWIEILAAAPLNFAEVIS